MALKLPSGLRGGGDSSTSGWGRLERREQGEREEDMLLSRKGKEGRDSYLLWGLKKSSLVASPMAEWQSTLSSYICQEKQ